MSELAITTRAGETFGAYAAYPDAGGPAPGLLLLNEVFGVNRFMRAIADYWAGRGFLAVCPKLYWRIDPEFELDPETPGHRDQALATRAQFDVDLAVSDTAAAVARLREMPECSGRVATQGYCLGGLLAFLHAARSDADCDISYYGVGIEDYLDEAARITRPVMLHIGEADPWTPVPVRDATAAALAGHDGAEIYTYPETDHAFAREGAATEVRAMKELANGRSEAMLDRGAALMRAVLCRSFDGIDAVTVENIAPDKPGPGEVRVRAAAVGVNFADSLVAAGQYQTRPDFPFSPGFECAGHIDALGPGVEGFEIGERVMAVMDYGAWREQVCVPAVHVYRLPESMDFVTAAGFPVTYGTSHIGLDHRGGLKAGETLLVHGAAGGVGLTAVEIGKAMGATVIATAGGPEKVAVALEHGADHGIDYRSEDIRVRVRDLTEGRGADVIYDPVGGDVFDASMRCIAWGGRLLVVGFAAGRIPQAPANLLLVKNIAAIGVYWSSHREREPERLQQSFADLFRLYEAGALKPRIAETWPLDGAAEALRRLLSRKVAGKIVLTTGETAS